jgi:hypothetical protein
MSASDRMRDLLREIAADADALSRDNSIDLGERRAWKALAAKARKATLIGTSLDPARRLKVYGLRMRRRGHRKECLALVATTSYREAARVLDCTIGHLRTYGGVTGNDADIAAATATPGVLVWSARP